MDTEGKKALRLKLLLKLFELTGGARHKSLDLKSVGQQLGLDEEPTLDAGRYLKDQGLIDYLGMGPQVGITHYGIMEAEERLQNPSSPSARFPAINIINVGQMVGSNIQQGSTASSLISVARVDVPAVASLVEALERALREAQLESRQRADAEAELATIQAQLKSSNPKPSILKESVETLKTIVQGGGQIVAASKIIQDLLSLLQ